VNAPERIAELERQLHWAQLKIQALEQELRQRRIQQLGPRSETLSNLVFMRRHWRPAATDRWL
jgi:hypothetical protein